MTQTFLFDEHGQPNCQAVVAESSIRQQIGAGMINKAQVHRETKPQHSGQRLRVLRHIEKMGDVGATRDEIASALNLPVSSVCGRVDELLDPRWPDVFETDQRRNTKYGKPAVVLVSVVLRTEKTL